MELDSGGTSPAPHPTVSANGTRRRTAASPDMIKNMCFRGNPCIAIAWPALMCRRRALAITFGRRALRSHPKGRTGNILEAIEAVASNALGACNSLATGVPAAESCRSVDVRVVEPTGRRLGT